MANLEFLSWTNENKIEHEDSGWPVGNLDSNATN